MKIYIEKCWITEDTKDLSNLHMFDFEKIHITKNPYESDILVQSCLNTIIKNKGKKILINMEPITPRNYNQYDIIISTHLKYPDLTKVFYYPYTFFHINSFKRVDYILNRSLYFNFENKKKFCLFVASNEKAWQRIDFFKRLSQYKHIDSRGRILTNFDRITFGHWTDEFLNEIRQYKFIICFENSDTKGYGTEKISNAYLGETVPIYWGNKDFYQYLNKKSMVLLEEYNEECINKAIQEIKELDNNDELYLEKIKEPLFVDNKIPEDFTIENIRDKILS